MSDQNKASGNVLQFPMRKKEAEVKPTFPATPAGHEPTQKPSKGNSKKTMAASVLAITLMTIAVNKYTFEGQSQSTDLASQSSSGRHIASVERLNWSRNAQWEKQLADRLASPQVRQVASTGVGRSATVEEKLRWGVLEEKYTIVYSPQGHKINTILLQDPISKPSYILDRSQFLRDYGQLLHGAFNTAKLKSVEKSEDKMVESYTLFDKDNKAQGEARFELDRHKRLLSLKVEPVQI